MGARVERGRALNYCACTQNLVTVWASEADQTISGAEHMPPEPLQQMTEWEILRKNSSQKCCMNFLGDFFLILIRGRSAAKWPPDPSLGGLCLTVPRATVMQ